MNLPGQSDEEKPGEFFRFLCFLRPLIRRSLPVQERAGSDLLSPERYDLCLSDLNLFGSFLLPVPVCRPHRLFHAHRKLRVKNFSPDI